ncbi:GDSL-type esterase/lipase family protein [Armatimonas sp.]|uniref:GDSL-type esterase/lipase family protein n=1 Tax=Armatimonas sp. TaxID=1872638 RepID=UPI003750E3D4
MLKNAAYTLMVQSDGTLSVSANTGGAPTRFAPQFLVLLRDSDPKLALRRAALPQGINYSVPTWLTASKTADGSLKAAPTDTTVTAGDGLNPTTLQGSGGNRTGDLFHAAASVTLMAVRSEVVGRTVHWHFAEHADFTLTAEVTLLPGRESPRLRFTFTPKRAGFYSVGYLGAAATESAHTQESWQPLIWQEKRFPSASFLTPAFHCPLPTTLVMVENQTYGLIAEPAELPFQPLPTFENSRFGVALRDSDGKARPMLFAPMLGGTGSKRKPSEGFTFSLRLITQPQSLLATYQSLARGLYGFRDYRQSTTHSLNQTLENMVTYGLSEYSQFNKELKGFSYETDAPGTVKNVSALHPLSAALVLDDPGIYKERAYPLIEYLLSREKFLFSTSPDIKIQNPSWRLLGPCAPLSELAALYATGEKRWLDAARTKADAYLKSQVQTRQSAFAPGTFFWNSFVPDFFALWNLYEATSETRYQDAAHEAALRFTQFIWLCPAIPQESITVNKGGKAPVYSYLAKRTKGPMPVPEETVPAWRLSEIGLTAEASGTSVGHRGIFLTCFAPWLLRIAARTGDTFLHDLARAAIIGRYASFPGYHMNTARTTVYEKPDYPLHAFSELSYNSFHFNHGWPHIALVLDYLISEVETRSHGAIRFPARYAEGYAYLKSRIYGDRPGVWEGDKDVWLWMPRGLVGVSIPHVNYIAARSGDGKTLYLALTNQSSEPVTVVLSFNGGLLPGHPINPRVKLAPKGIATLKIPGMQIRPQFQKELLGMSATRHTPENRAHHTPERTMIFFPPLSPPHQTPAVSAPLAEFYPRGGLPNVAAKGAAGQPLRVAFLGGSITAAEGWRVHTRENLKKQFPKSAVTEIFAAVSGTGSNFGAARLERDVLSKKPDLLFVEFAVNDGVGSAKVEAQLEGIVRQTWAARPTTDICFVYTVSENMLPELKAGRYQSSAVSMERVAAHYGIPSLNFGVEVARRVAAGTLVFTSPRDSAGFTKDKVHPGAAGHQLYAERLAGALPGFFATGTKGAHALPAPLSPGHWQRARLLTLDSLTLSSHWSRVSDTDPHLTTQKGGLVPPTWTATQPGARIAFRFKGTQLGLVGLKGPENGIFRVTVDGKSVEGTLFDAYSQPGRFFLKPWFFPETLTDTDHDVQLELLAKAPDKSAVSKTMADKTPFAINGLYLSGILIVGEQRWSGEGYRTDSKHWSTQKPENVTVKDGFLWLELKKEDAGDKHYTGALQDFSWCGLALVVLAHDPRWLRGNQPQGNQSRAGYYRERLGQPARLRGQYTQVEPTAPPELWRPAHLADKYCLAARNHQGRGR